MIYPLIITIALLAVWGTAAYMSIAGLMAVFAGQVLVAGFLAGGLELGKLMTVIHLHRAWLKIGMAARIAYLIVVVVLTTLTAVEAGGYLIQSHRAGHTALAAAKAVKQGLIKDEALLRQRIAAIDDNLDQLPHGYVTRRITERKAAGYDDLQDQLQENIAKQQRMDLRLAAAGAKASPVIALAEIAGQDDPQCLLIFIGLLVCIMEPLSIGLAVATSMAWLPNQAPKPDPILAKNGRIGQNGRKRPAEMAQNADDMHTDFLAMVERYNLTPEVVAEITDRRKLSTVKSWMAADGQIPEKAMRAMRKWQSDMDSQLKTPS